MSGRLRQSQVLLYVHSRLQIGVMRTIIVTLDKIFLTFAEGYSSQSKSDIAGSSIHLLKTAAENRSRAGSANEPISEVSGGSQTSTASDSCK